MSVRGKNSLGTVVECAESTEEGSGLLANSAAAAPPTGDDISIEADALGRASRRHRSEEARSWRLRNSSGKSQRRAVFGGQPLSLFSIFGFSSNRKRNSKQRSGSATGEELLTVREGSEEEMRTRHSLSEVGSMSQAGSFGGGLPTTTTYTSSGSPASGDLDPLHLDSTDDAQLRDRESWERRESNGGEQPSTVQLSTVGSADGNGNSQPTLRRIAQLCSQAGSTAGLKKMRECPLCFIRQPAGNFPKLMCCNHRSCRSCLVQYLQVEIMESRVQVTCPECTEQLHPSDIYALMVHHPELIEKYESFSLRRVLMTDPDTRWCPAPDCTYAVIASSCAACPELRCERPGCGTLFCYHCKGPWHASQTCDEARKERGGFRPSVPQIQSAIDNTLKRGDIKACPRCRTYIVKMNDGSCNHMVCAMCSAEFCWLCLKEINDLHYLSPTGCTFWGKKPWTRKKKLLWQVGTLIGAPVGIALIAGLAIPGIIFGVPVFVGRKVNQHFAHHSKVRRRLLTASSVFGSLVVSPVLAVMAVGVGVPIMLAYVYGVVPLSLCRNGGCGVGSGSASAERNEVDDDEIWHDMNGGNQEKSRLLNDSERQDGTSVVTGISINSGLSNAQQPHSRLQVQAEMCRRRPSIESGVMSLGDKCNYEEASTKAMAGSQYYDDKSVHTMCSGQEAVSYCEEVASTVALAGSMLDAKSLTDSTSGRVVVAQLCGRDRDLSPASHHAVIVSDLAKIGEDRPCSSNYHHHQEGVASHSREGDAQSCGSCKRRGRATSSASMGSARLASRISHSPHSNSQQFVNLVVAPNPEDSDELVLMSEDTAANLANEGAFAQGHFSNAAAALRNAHSSAYAANGMWAVHSADGEQSQNADRFYIRAIFDTMKQIVSDDVAAENPADVPPAARTSTSGGVRSAFRRSGSVKSVTNSAPEPAAVSDSSKGGSGGRTSNSSSSGSDQQQQQQQQQGQQQQQQQRGGGGGSSSQTQDSDSSHSTSSGTSASEGRSSKRHFFAHFLRKNRL